jgi:tripartite-type tricarboxylate transporter receptor subunit TctC
MLRFSRALGALVATCFLLTAQAQSPAAPYPTKPIRIVVTFPPGGSSDAIVRMLVPRLSEKLGQQVVVDALSANVSLYAQMPFDPIKDFTPVSMLAAIPFVIIGHPSVNAKTQRELIALAKSEPGKLSIGHGGNGTAMHLTAQLFEQMADIKLVDVPYKGSGPATIDVLAGQVPLAVVDLPSALPQIKAGKLTAYAVTSPRRLPALPDVPTVAEQGLTGYDSTGWFGVVAPAGTPAAIVERLNAEITAALNDDEIKARMRNLGVEPAPSTPAEFEAYIKSETQKWGKVIKAAGIKIE